jgi:hypothetical protein
MKGEQGFLAPTSQCKWRSDSCELPHQNQVVLTIWYSFIECALKKLGAELYQTGP